MGRKESNKTNILYDTLLMSKVLSHLMELKFMLGDSWFLKC